MTIMGKILAEHGAVSYMLKFVSLLLINFKFNGLLGFFSIVCFFLKSFNLRGRKSIILKVNGIPLRFSSLEQVILSDSLDTFTSLVYCHISILLHTVLLD